MSYPSSIDSFSTKNTGDVIQAADVNNVQTAVVSLENKVGITGSAVTTSIDYLLTSTSSVSPGHKHATTDIVGGNFVPTGGVLPYAGSSAPTGYLICDGSAVSRTTYATLFGIVSSTYGNGDGVSTFNLPDLRSRVPVGVGTGTKVFNFSSRSTNTITATGMANSTTNENQTGQAVLYHSTGSVITGLTDNTTYYLIRQTYNTFNLATSLANAQNGTAISLSSDGSGTQTFTFTLTARALADTGGEETHAISSTELIAHTHPLPNSGSGTNNAFATTTGGGPQTNTAGATSSTGGNAAMNNMSSFLSLNYIIKT